MKVLAITSGGLDSTVTYYKLKNDGHDVDAVFFDYGQRHRDQEHAALNSIIPEHRTINVALPDLDSALLGTSEVPAGEYEAGTMRATVVPFRNAVFLAYAVAIAENDGYDAVALGAHAGDHDLYPDCTPAFVEAFDVTAQAGTYNKVRVLAPFAHSTKRDIVKYGKSVGIGHVMAQTYSCYKGGGQPCGVCSTCREREAAFAD